VVERASTPAGLVLVLAGLVAAVHLGIKTIRLDRVPRERMLVVLILMFFVMLFWAFFEQAGSSVNNFTDRNVDRVFEKEGTITITTADVGQTIRVQPTQEQLGYHNGERLFTLSSLDELRAPKPGDEGTAKDDKATNGDVDIEWKVASDNVGMRVATRTDEVPASYLQSVNPVYILVFGLVFTALWGFLGVRGLEPSTPFKFALGLLQLGLGFGAFWYGAENADQRGMVFVGWLLFGYLLHTSGELCLSPVGLAMVTKLSPRELVSTVMGAWFLSTAFSQFLAGIIAQFTRVDVGDGAAGTIPPPLETVHVYGTVFGRIAIAAIISSAICFALVPLLKRWMHEEAD
jgi:dipeptide/tripeptide permease